jgi:hypothetical protein
MIRKDDWTLYGTKVMIGPSRQERSLHSRAKKLRTMYRLGGVTIILTNQSLNTPLYHKLSGLTHICERESQETRVFCPLVPSGHQLWTKGHVIVPKLDQQRGYASKPGFIRTAKLISSKE